MSFVDDSRHRQLNRIKRGTTALETLDSVHWPATSRHQRGPTSRSVPVLKTLAGQTGSPKLYWVQATPVRQVDTPTRPRRQSDPVRPERGRTEDISRAVEVIGIESFLLELSAQAGKTSSAISRRMAGSPPRAQAVTKDRIHIAIVPARAGSKEPGKNIKEFQGIPMIIAPSEYSQAKLFDQVVVSTDS